MNDSSGGNNSSDGCFRGVRRRRSLYEEVKRATRCGDNTRENIYSGCRRGGGLGDLLVGVLYVVHPADVKVQMRAILQVGIVCDDICFHPVVTLCCVDLSPEYSVVVGGHSIGIGRRLL